MGGGGHVDEGAAAMGAGMTCRPRSRLLAFTVLTAALALSTVTIGTLPATATADDDTTPPSAFDFVADAGQFQTGYRVASPYANVYITWEPSTDDQSSVKYEVSVDGVLVRTVTGEDGSHVITRRIEVVDGEHVVTVVAVDAANNRTSATHSLDLVVDQVDPWFTSKPTLQLWPGPVTDEGYPMRYSWTGDDSGTGLASVHIGPNSTCCFTVGPELTHFDFDVSPRSEKVWRIRLFDGVGRNARVPRSGYVSPAKWTDTSSSRGWQKVRAAKALGGSEFRSTDSGDRFSITASGKSLGWVASTGPQRGRAEVLVGGKRVATVNLYSPTVNPAEVVWTTQLTPGRAQKVTIVNRSGHHRPMITVDALLVHR